MSVNLLPQYMLASFQLHLFVTTYILAEHFYASIKDSGRRDMMGNDGRDGNDMQQRSLVGFELGTCHFSPLDHYTTTKLGQS